MRNIAHDRASGGDAVFVHTDMALRDEVKALVARAVSLFGRVDMACNKRGIDGRMASTADCTEENWDRALAVNLTGVWWCMKYEIPQMLAQGGGAIVNMASVAGLVGFRNLPAYCASNGGVILLTKGAALEYATQGIRINALCPGVIRTTMVDRVLGGDPEMEAQFIALEPVGRLGTPEEVAAAVLWLCSDTSSFVTGAALPVDGGFVAQEAGTAAGHVSLPYTHRHVTIRHLTSIPTDTPAMMRTPAIGANDGSIGITG